MRAQYAFVKASWHSDIVNNALLGFLEIIPKENVEVYDVPGAFELPLVARDLAETGKYSAIICAAFVVDGGIYRNEFVAQTVVDALMHVGLETDIPVLSVSLTPHQFQQTDHHSAQFKMHFVKKGQEAAQAAMNICELRQEIQDVHLN